MFNYNLHLPDIIVELATVVCIGDILYFWSIDWFKVSGGIGKELKIDASYLLGLFFFIFNGTCSSLFK